MRAEDALKYAAAIVRERIEWTVDDIGGGMCTGHDHDIPLDALMDLRIEIEKLVVRYGDPHIYSDGRKVKTDAWIEDGVCTSQVWHPEPSEQKSRSWRGNLRHDPGVPCPGIYEVTTYPATQEIHVRVVRTV